MPLKNGEVFADYVIQRFLGAGAMGEVYLAQHPRLPRLDALKVLPSALTANTEFRQRFNREADIAATLWHPHIVGIHDRGEFNAPYLRRGTYSVRPEESVISELEGNKLIAF